MRTICMFLVRYLQLEQGVSAVEGAAGAFGAVGWGTDGLGGGEAGGVGANVG